MNILLKADKNSDGAKIFMLAGAFLALIFSDTVFHVDLGIFKVAGMVLSYAPMAWTSVFFLYLFFAFLFVQRTVWLFRCQQEKIFDTVALFAAVFVSAGILPHLSPTTMLVGMTTHLTFGLIIAPLFCLYAGTLLGWYAFYEKSLLFYPAIILGMAFFGLGTYFFGMAALAILALF